VTSIAFAYLAGTFLSVTVPFSIAGYSAASNHMAWRLLHNNHPSANDSRTLNAKAGYHLHPWVPDLPITASVLADSFLRAKENHFPDDDSMVLDRRLMTEWYLSALPFAELERRQHCFARIRAALADSSELLAWFDSLDLTRFMPAAPRMFRRETPAFDGQFLTVDLSAFGIHDVVAAAKLSADLLRWPVKEVPFDLPCFAERAHFLSQKYTELDALYLNGGLKSFVQVVLKRLVGKLVEKLFPWRRAA
jgi:hypothetical protein